MLAGMMMPGSTSTPRVRRVLPFLQTRHKHYDHVMLHQKCNTAVYKTDSSIYFVYGYISNNLRILNDITKTHNTIRKLICCF